MADDILGLAEGAGQRPPDARYLTAPQALIDLLCVGQHRPLLFADLVWLRIQVILRAFADGDYSSLTGRNKRLVALSLCRPHLLDGVQVQAAWLELDSSERAAVGVWSKFLGPAAEGRSIP